MIANAFQNCDERAATSIRLKSDCEEIVMTLEDQINLLKSEARKLEQTIARKDGEISLYIGQQLQSENQKALLSAAKKLLHQKASESDAVVASSKQQLDELGNEVRRLKLENDQLKQAILAPSTEIYIARVTGFNNELQPESVAKVIFSHRTNYQTSLIVFQAIDWAVKEWKVTIISMSLGFDSEYTDIHRALKEAHNVMVFAACSGEAANKNVPNHPARDRTVFGINSSGFNINASKGDSTTPSRSTRPLAKMFFRHGPWA